MLTRLVIALLLFVSTTSTFDAKSPATNSKQSLINIAKSADLIASKYNQMGWFSGSVLLAKDGDVFFIKSYDNKSLIKSTKNSKHTKYNLGSIAKNFTKVLVLQQIESGTLRLNDSIDKFNLGFPKEISSKVTVESLLNHSSGFADIFTAEYRENQLAFDTLEKKLQLLQSQPLLFEPGTEHRYSNYGYIVLGSILERVTNLTFEQLLKREIFDRIDLKGTAFKVNPADKYQSTRYAYLYDDSIKEVGIVEHPGPDGGIESNVQDVQKFYRELFYGDRLLNHSNPMVVKSFAMNGKHWSAYGGGLGVSAAVEVNLAQGFEVIVLANTDNLVAERISQRVNAFINEGAYQAIKPLEINFAYRFYKQQGKEIFYESFRKKYEENGYKIFIGRTVNELGMQLLRTHSWDQAFDIFNYLIAIFPGAPEAYDSLAFAYLTKGEPSQAQKVFKKALAINADFKSDYVKSNYLYSSNTKATKY